MRPEIFSNGDSVLLLGEGNFTFTLGLNSLGLDLKITATCFESVLTESQIKNCGILESSGVCILTGIDATKIHEHSLLMTKKFDKIVFNFPHTGGKMKIHLNRELLRLFFQSASNLLTMPSGRIIVSLCRGQGADYLGKRVWADSWQVVDLAGQAHLLLVECSPFDWATYPMYSNVGYRSLEKGFHSEDSVVHIFSHVKRNLNCHLHDVLEYYKVKIRKGDQVCQPAFARKLKKNISEDNASPVFFILSLLEKSLNLKLQCHHYVEKKPFPQSSEEEARSLALQLWRESAFEGLLYSVHILNECITDFKLPIVTTLSYFIGKDSYNILKTAVARLLFTFKFTDGEIIEDACHSDINRTKQMFLRVANEESKILIAELTFSNSLTESQPILKIFLDALVMKMFSLTSWKQLWSCNIQVVPYAGKPSVIGICPYPVTYSFDLSFIINEMFTEEILFQFLRNIADEILESVTKVSEYCCSDSGEKSLCYRLLYLSYDQPMCRMTVIDFHQNVLGRALETVLGVRLK